MKVWLLYEENSEPDDGNWALEVEAIVGSEQAARDYPWQWNLDRGRTRYMQEYDTETGHACGDPIRV